MTMNSQVNFRRHSVAIHRRHYVDEEDVRVVLGRLPEYLLERLNEVHFSDAANGNRTLGYTSTRGRRHVTLCALPERVSLRQFSNARPPENFGALDGAQWPVLAVRRFMLYDVLIHEIGHLQVIIPKSKNINRKFAGESMADTFAKTWRKKLWSTPFEHSDPVHNPPGEDELEALRSGWIESHSCYKRGLTREKSGNSREAARLYSEAVAKYPNHALALERLGVLAYGGFVGDSNDWGRTIEHLRSALKQDPTLWNATLFLAMTLDMEGSRDESQAMFERALHLDHYSDLSRTVYAEYLGNWGEHQESERLFKRVLKKDSTSFLALRNYASMLMYKVEDYDEKDTERAIALLNRVPKLESDYSSQYLLGIAESWRDDMASAIRHMRRTVELRPDYSNAEELLRKWEAQEGECCC